MRQPLHPLEEALLARVQLLATTLRPATVKHYRQTTRLFMTYLRQNFPDVRRADQLRRDPHMLGWFQDVWLRRVSYNGKPWCAHTRGGHLIRLRKLLDLLGDHRYPPGPGLIFSQDIPRADQVLPRPLTPEDDDRLQSELHRREDDLACSILLLVRLTGMRIGEAADLSVDCLRHLGGDHWALHVPVGKLHNDRLVPVDEQVRTIVARLQFLRTLPPAAPPEFLLPRPKGRQVLCTQLRAALCEAAGRAGITAHIVPHQMRHTFATSMLRAGVSLPALMKLLGHRTANMTLRYVQVTQKDLQREFHLARQTPRYLIPLPPSAAVAQPDVVNAATVIDRLASTIHVLELYRQLDHRQLDPIPDPKQIELLHRRLVRIRSRFQKVTQK